LDLPLAGPALWLIDDQPWIAGRWFVTPQTTHIGVFKIESDKPALQMVLPSGPGFDCSYVGVARWPHNRHRFALSYYSGHVAPEDPSVTQWEHPQIYVADAVFNATYIAKWSVSDLDTKIKLSGATRPDPAQKALGWREVQSYDANSAEPGFTNVSQIINNRDGVIYLVADVQTGPCDRGHLLLGYDGPVRVWLNGQQVFEGPGTNPALPDKTSIPVPLQHGSNRVALALDTNSGKAWGIYGRIEVEG
jgi:hypothetical protein